MYILSAKSIQYYNLVIMRKSMSIVFLLSVIFISLGLGAYTQSNNGRLFEAMEDGPDENQDSAEGQDEINSEDADLNEKPPLSEVTVANGLKNSPLNNDGVKCKCKDDDGVERKEVDGVESKAVDGAESKAVDGVEDIEKVEPFSAFTKSDYSKY